MQHSEKDCFNYQNKLVKDWKYESIFTKLSLLNQFTISSRTVNKTENLRNKKVWGPRIQITRLNQVERFRELF